MIDGTLDVTVDRSGDAFTARFPGRAINNEANCHLFISKARRGSYAVGDIVKGTEVSRAILSQKARIDR